MPEGVNSILITIVGGYAQVTPNVVAKTTPGETITVVVGKGGTNAVANSNWQDKSVYERFVNKNGVLEEIITLQEMAL